MTESFNIERVDGQEPTFSMGRNGLVLPGSHEFIRNVDVQTPSGDWRDVPVQPVITTELRPDGAVDQQHTHLRPPRNRVKWMEEGTFYPTKIYQTGIGDESR